MDPQSSKINRDISGLPRDFHPRIPHLPLSSGKLETSIAPIFPSPTTTTPLLWLNKALQHGGTWNTGDGRLFFGWPDNGEENEGRVPRRAVGWEDEFNNEVRGLNSLAWR